MYIIFSRNCTLMTYIVIQYSLLQFNILYSFRCQKYIMDLKNKDRRQVDIKELKA